MKKLLIVALLGALLLPFSCKKYEDGPWLSFRTPIKRLLGIYNLTSYYVDNIDSLTLYHDSLGLSFRFFYNEVTYKYNMGIEGGRKDGFDGSVTCIFILTNNNGTIKFSDANGNIGTGPFGYKKQSEWEILRLTNNETVLKTTYNSKEYLIELKKK